MLRRMTVASDRRPPAQRLLDTAGELFAAEGIRAVGIDRLLAASGVAKASMYQSFGSKDALVVAYLARQHAEDREALETAAATRAEPRDRVLLPFDLAADRAHRRDFRGCLYLNAATEFPGPDSPVAAVVAEHRAWLAAYSRAALVDAGRRDPEALAARWTVLYDGGLAGSKAARTSAPIRVARAMAEELLTR